MENQTKKKGALVAIITMMFLFAMIAFVTNMAAPFGTIWKEHYDWAGMMGNMMNFAAYLFMGIPAGMMITKYGYKKTALVALALGFIGIVIQYCSSTMDGNAISTYVVYLLGAFICGSHSILWHTPTPSLTPCSTFLVVVGTAATSLFKPVDHSIHWLPHSPQSSRVR